MTAPTTLDWVHTNVCLSPALTTDQQGRLRLQPFAVPRVPTGCDVIAKSGGDGKVFPDEELPGKLLIDRKMQWYNDTPLEHMVLIRATRSWRGWVTSNPNAIQVRDRWESAINDMPPMPTALDNTNSEVGSAIDISTDTTAEPKAGRHWSWRDATCEDEWVGPIAPGDQLNMWYQAYGWTPPPWADNANSASPQHNLTVNYTRLQLMVFPIYDLAEGQP